MRIAAVEHILPTRRVTNEWIVDRVREHNADRFKGAELRALEDGIRRTLANAGTEIRYHCSEDERPIDLALRASRQALASAGVGQADIDFVIYAAVGRGWLEPATAPAFQSALGLSQATAFDVLDACAGWLRALHIAHAYLRGGIYRRGLIINCECGVFAQHAAWSFERIEDLEHRAAAFTIGEAATATLVDADDPYDDFHFAFRTAGQHHGLCMIPLRSAEGYTREATDKRLSPGSFFSLSHQLVEVVTANIYELFESEERLRRPYDISFGHEVSEKVCAAVARRLGVEGVYFPTHRRFGNTVSASVPLGISIAMREGRLRRGHKVLIIVGASGVSVGLAAFTF